MAPSVLFTAALAPATYPLAGFGGRTGGNLQIVCVLGRRAIGKTGVLYRGPTSCEEASSLLLFPW